MAGQASGVGADDAYRAPARVHTGQPAANHSSHAALDPMFKTENFMMYGFKIAMCTKQGRHPWCDCPYAHPTENARRRDPRVFSYGCVECPSYRNGGFCTKGDQCEFSHGVFEARLHPDSFRTVACKDGRSCRRKVCFFYHTPEEMRRPTGLQDARAQLAAEMGTAAMDMDIDAMRSVANSILTANPSLAQTMKSMSSSLTPVANHQSMLNSVLSAQNSLSGPLASSASLTRSPSGGISRMLSGNLQTVTSGALIATETVAPCMKGANKNKALIKELATEVAMHPEQLMNFLRMAALQGELTSHSAAPSAAFGSVPDNVERILMRVSVLEDCPIDKLRGWLLRVPGANPFIGETHAHKFDEREQQPQQSAGAMKATPWRLQAHSHSESRQMQDASSTPIRAHFGSGPSGNSSGRRSGWDVRPPPRNSSGGGLSEARRERSVRSAIDAARW